jgi:hypothetical protein
MIGARDPRDVILGKFLARAVHHMAELARVDEQHLAAPVAEGFCLSYRSAI